MTKKISRKDFIKSFRPFPSAASPRNNGDDDGTLNYRDNDPGKTTFKDGYFSDDEKKWPTRRGSWLQSKDDTAEGLVLVKNGKGCRIIFNEKEPSSVRQAAIFLASDISRITGFLPDLYVRMEKRPDETGETLRLFQSHKRPEGSDQSATTADRVLNTTINLVTIGNDRIPEEINTGQIHGKWEAHKVVTKDNEVWLIGSDARGTAFAAYVFCERIGIDPLYLWTGYTPERKETLAVRKIDYTAFSPTFKYRGFFHDDEDILPRPFERSGYPLRIGDIDLKWYKMYFETALRLRMNMVAPYTRVHRRFEVQQCASDWGLFYTSHHYDILLSNPFGFEIFDLAKRRNVDPDWNWFANKQGMIDYWRAGVVENERLNCIWPVGLRGLGDRAYPFPENATESDQSKVFNDVIKAQVKTVKEITSCVSQPVFTFTLFREMFEKYEKGKEFFQLPDDTIIVWSDDNEGGMNRLPEKLEKWKHGVYYHLSVAGIDSGIQSAHIVSPHTITEQFKKVMKAGTTEYLLVNISEMREFVMEARLLADISWDASSVLDKDRPADDYIRWWCNEYFGAKSIAHATMVYEGYYKLLPRSNYLYFGSEMVMKILGQLKLKFEGKKYELIPQKDISLLTERDQEYQSAMNRFSKAAGYMTRQQEQFFFENTKVGLSFDWRPTQAALLLNKALEENNFDKAWSYIRRSIEPLEQLELDILRAERPPFHKWYRETWLRRTLSNLNVHRSHIFVRTFISSNGKEFLPADSSSNKARANIPQYQAWNDFMEDMQK